MYASQGDMKLSQEHHQAELFGCSYLRTNSSMAKMKGLYLVHVTVWASGTAGFRGSRDETRIVASQPSILFSSDGLIFRRSDPVWWYDGLQQPRTYVLPASPAQQRELLLLHSSSRSQKLTH